MKQEQAQDPMAVAHCMYPVTIAEQVIRELRTQVNKKACRNYKKEITAPKCTGFCRTLKLQESIWIKGMTAAPLLVDLLSMICAAHISSQKEGAPSDRQIRIVENTLAPIITEGFIGVCCKSMQKVCNHLKQSLEQSRQEGTRRITKYDGKVHQIMINSRTTRRYAAD